MTVLQPALEERPLTAWIDLLPIGGAVWTDLLPKPVNTADSHCQVIK